MDALRRLVLKKRKEMKRKQKLEGKEKKKKKKYLIWDKKEKEDME